MFSRNKKGNGQLQAATERTVPSIVSSDLKIIGDLNSTGEVQIDGQVSGDIRAKVLLVGESAQIDGEILADTVRVHGRVNGQIKAKFVNLAKTAHVVGDILHENLSIQEGAFLEGHIMHMSEADVKAMESQTPKVETVSSGTSKPAEDRVNLVVKAGAVKPQAAQPQPAQPSVAAPKAVTGS